VRQSITLLTTTLVITTIVACIMEDVIPEEDSADRNLTETINKMVNASLTGDHPNSTRTEIAQTNSTGNSGTLGEDGSHDDEFFDAGEVPEDDEDGSGGHSDDQGPKIRKQCKESEVCKPCKEPEVCKPCKEPEVCKPCKEPEVGKPCKEPEVCKPCKEPEVCKPCKPCRLREGVKTCQPVPCLPVPCSPVDCRLPPGIEGPGVAAPMTVPVALAVGAAASVLVLGVVAFVGFVIRYLPIYISGTIFIVSILLTGYLSSRYPASARELGLRAVGLAREAASALANRVTAALRGPDQVGSALKWYSSRV
jgi:hypothetical protein